jgi:hypothetical protein
MIDLAIPPEVGPAPITLRARTAALNILKTAIARGPDAQAAHRQQAKGKLTARERIELLVDPGSFHEGGAIGRHRATGFPIQATQSTQARSDLRPALLPQRQPLIWASTTSKSCSASRSVSLFVQQSAPLWSIVNLSSLPYSKTILTIKSSLAAELCPLVCPTTRFSPAGARGREGTTL